MPQTKHEKFVHSLFKKGREVKINMGDHDGEFGVIKRVADDEGKRFLRIKLDNSNKSIEQTTEEVKLIPEKNLPEEFNTIGDIGDREDFMLVNIDTDVEATKDMIADPRKDDFGGFFVKIGDGEILEAYGFSGNIAYKRLSLTRLETTTEHLKRTIV